MSRPSKRHSEDYDAYKTGSSKYREKERRDRERDRDRNNRDRDRSRSHDRSPSPKHYKTGDTKKSKIAQEPPRKPGIQIKLSGAKAAVPMKPKLTVASAFNQDSDSEPEEMPPEARMRMRNIGRDTPTSAGPNSFGKTKHGFCDAKKVFEKSLKEAMNQTQAD